MLRNRLVSVVFVSSSMALAACGGAVTPPATAAADAASDASPSTSASATEAPPPRSAGLATPTNDPKIVAAVKKVLSCGWSQDEGFDRECAAYKEWDDNSDLFESAEGENDHKAPNTLLNLVEDKDEKVRALAVNKFPSRGDDIFKDKSSAQRILAQAERETSKTLSGPMGSLVGNIDFDKTGLSTLVAKMFETSTSADFRRAVVEGVLSANPHSDDALALVRKGLASDDHDIRYSAVMGLRDAKFEAERCAEYVKALDDGSSDVVGLAAQQFGYMECPAQVDVFLAYAKKRATAGNVKESMIPGALENLCTSGKISDDQKKLSADLAKSFASGKNEDFVRSDGLEAAMACDSKGGRAFVEGFGKDSNKWVKDSVKRLLKKKKGK